MSIEKFRSQIIVAVIVSLFFPLIFIILMSIFGILSGGIGGLIYSLVFLRPLLIVILMIFIARAFLKRFPLIGLSQPWAFTISFLIYLSFNNLINSWLYLSNLGTLWFSPPILLVVLLAVAMSISGFSKESAKLDKNVQLAWNVLLGTAIIVCILNLPKIADPLNTIPHGWKLSIQLSQEIRSFLSPVYGLDRLLPISLDSLLVLVFAFSLGFVIFKTKSISKKLAKNVE